MNDFNFYSPTKLILKSNYYQDLIDNIKNFNHKNILLVYGNHSLKSGLITEIKELIKSNIPTSNIFELKEVRVNPTKEKVYEGISIAKNNNVDLIIAIGGGSVIDTSKAIGAGALVDFDFYKFNLKEEIPNKTLPLYVILTIAASGSELSDSCVISDDLNNLKLGFNNDIVRPKISFLNPNYLKTLPFKEMARGIVDIFMHTFERYIYHSIDNGISDSFAIALLKELVINTYKYLKNPKDYDALSNIMLLGSFSHNGLTSIGKKYILIVHKLEHNIGGFYPLLVHADGLAILLMPFLNNYKFYIKDKLIRLGKEVFNLKNLDDENLINFTFKEIDNLFRKLNMPKKFRELNITFDLEDMTRDFLGSNNETYHYSVHDLDFNMIKTIYKESL